MAGAARSKAATRARADFEAALNLVEQQAPDHPLFDPAVPLAVFDPALVRASPTLPASADDDSAG